MLTYVVETETIGVEQEPKDSERNRSIVGRSARIGSVMRQQGACKFSVHLAETRIYCDRQNGLFCLVGCLLGSSLLGFGSQESGNFLGIYLGLDRPQNNGSTIA